MLMHNSGVGQWMDICYGIFSHLLGRLLDACPFQGLRFGRSWSWHGNLAFLDSVLALLFGGVGLCTVYLFDTMQ
jgi:hypothetical protein